MRRRQLYCVLLLCLVFWACMVLIYFLLLGNTTSVLPAAAALGERVDHLQRLLQQQIRESASLRVLVDAELSRLQLQSTTSILQTTTSSPAAALQQDISPPKEEAIAVLVIACNRPQAITYHVKKLLQYRPSKELFPIIISQDCDSEPVLEAVREFGANVTHVKHKSAQEAGIKVPSHHQQYEGYYKIARHYGLALKYVFDVRNFSAVIITEDDLDIAGDFFEYFSATRAVLEQDESLLCVSAWNDNGKAHLIDGTAHSLLYRSDFFPGLGWMMSRRLWREVGGRWPAGFWDDWIRDPAQRRRRACIRPEISRTAMTLAGKIGASKGLFFTKHLSQIKLNDLSFEFTSQNLSYLHKDVYDRVFLDTVSATVEVSAEEVKKGSFVNGSALPSSVRVSYETAEQFIAAARTLDLMADFKAGVPRTAYMGIVSAYYSGRRVYLQKRNWQRYDPSWQGPPDIQ